MEDMREESDSSKYSFIQIDTREMSHLIWV